MSARTTVTYPADPRPRLAPVPDPAPSTVRGRTIELPEPPTDEERDLYLGPQRRWVIPVSFLCYVLIVISIGFFVARHIWAVVLVLPLIVSAVGTTISLVTSSRRRRDTLEGHRAKVASWNPAHVPSIDVFLPSAGEDLAVLSNTYRHVSALQWRGEVNVLVLDDSAREDVRRLAHGHGFTYLSRPNRGWFKKAGNLRYAFEHSAGDVILVLDADFVPRPDALTELVPYLDDPAIGIVQSPQYFDSHSRMNWIQRAAGATQILFYRWVQPSRDRSRAAICVGTSALYRRAGLDAAGGYALIGHSEDVHTGVNLMRAGYEVRYVPTIVTKGLCPDTIDQFATQQYRWCTGSMSLLFSRGFHRLPLTSMQRLSYWSGFLYYITTAVNVFVTARAADPDGLVRARTRPPGELRLRGAGHGRASVDRPVHHPGTRVAGGTCAHPDDVLLLPCTRVVRRPSPAYRRLGGHRRGRAVEDCDPASAAGSSLVRRRAGAPVGRDPAAHAGVRARPVLAHDRLRRAQPRDRAAPGPRPYRAAAAASSRPGGLTMATTTLTPTRTRALPPPTAAPAPRRSPTWLGSALLWLPVIWAAQLALALRPGLNRNAFEDEGLYVYMGHRVIAHLLHGSPLPEVPGSYFSGAPSFYPVLAAMADSVGGLAAARGVSLLFALVATGAVYLIGERLYGRTAGLLGAAAFVLCGSVIFQSHLAVYDSTTMAFGALAAYAAVRGAQDHRLLERAPRRSAADAGRPGEVRRADLCPGRRRARRCGRLA